MVDIKTNGNGLTYLLADYAKSVNGGKSLKINAKKWESVMKLVADINSKRSANEKIFTGGTNLFGKANENFVLSNKTISFSDAEIALILKEMGVESPSKKEEILPPDDFKIKGLSIERSNSDTAKVFTRKECSIKPETEEGMPAKPMSKEAKTIDTPELDFQNSPNKIPEKTPTYTFADFKEDVKYNIAKFEFAYEKDTNATTKNPAKLSETNELRYTNIVSSAKDTTNLVPPYKITTPNPGKRGGGTKTISEQFHKRTMEIADKICCTYEDLITVLNFESGIDPTSGIKNPRKKPVGLLQFTETGIRGLNKTYGLNLTKEKILQMNEIEQLELVEKYFEMVKREAPRLRNKRQLDAADLYTLTLLPARAGRDELCRADEKDNRFYRRNQGIDITGDGIITRADVLTKLNEFRINVQVV